MDIVLLVIILYLIPTVVAVYRKHNNKAPIVIVNLTLGWTIAGWLAAIVWASTDNTKAV